MAEDGLGILEIDRQHSSDELISLRLNGELLPPAAGMLCLILASCGCESIPAFLFVRPYLPQRRWNVDGEIEVYHTQGLPEWPKQIFHRQRQESVGKAAAGNGEVNFYASAIGHRLVTGDATFYNLSQATASLRRQHILSAHFDEDDVWLQLNVREKAQIWHQTSIDDRVLLWFCLLKLVVFSYPDICSESCWEKVQCQCQDLVGSTVSPFLAVIGWEQLKSHKAFIPHLMSFLINYSVSKGSHLKLQSILEPSLLQDLIQDGDQVVQDTISILKFQEHFYYAIFLQPRVNESLFIQEEHFVPKFSGFVAITVALMLDIVPAALHSRIVSVISNWRQLILGETTSTIEHFAFIVLYLYNLEIKDLSLDYIEASIDLELKMSLGLEMARYQRAPEASAILGSCVKDMQTAGCIGIRECCIITTEFVKCCNMMSEEAKAESIARLVLGSQRDSQLQFQHDLCHLNLALADSLMGQGEYKSAEALMSDILAVGSLPRRTQTIIRLRLNKARRRLGRNELIASVKAGFMQPVLESIADLNQDLKTEVFAELSATASFAPKQNDKVFESLTDLICDTVAAANSAPVQNLNRAKFGSMEEGMDQLLQPRWAGFEQVFGPPTQRGRSYSNLLRRLFSSRERRRENFAQQEHFREKASLDIRLCRELYAGFETIQGLEKDTLRLGRYLAPIPETEQRELFRTALSHAETNASASNKQAPDYEGSDPSNVPLPPETLPQRVLEGREELETPEHVFTEGNGR